MKPSSECISTPTMHALCGFRLWPFHSAKAHSKKRFPPPSSSPPRLWPSWEHERMPPHLDPRSSYTLCIAEDPKPDAEFRRRRNSLAMTKIEETRLQSSFFSPLFPHLTFFPARVPAPICPICPSFPLFPLNPFPIFAAAVPPPLGTERG